jgi:pentose-5-phosphate-3-epimerase
VTEYNAGTLAAAGANWLVAGSAVFGGPDIEERFAVVAQAAVGGV